MNDLQKAAARVCQFFSMVEAAAELLGEPIKDETVVMSFMGSGASDNLTMREIRDLRDALAASEH